ncbi:MULTISPECIES: MAE_28990/MAE_18760 family HEPN-like nuclease [Xanthomonas]|uniref:HEPN domain-containing protein n=1 Tax=Xanthomonas TaxID=338 RepID=UPI001265513C|nr:MULTISPECIES: MAE_28990/MAE_18760 family HEPN-like nuclease [Xanthomonas]MCW0390252.1 hypothetical protein [Xanthomonas sacchari]MCW0455773.1 hypothetical protein [Xanthomonas sacchari]
MPISESNKHTLLLIENVREARRLRSLASRADQASVVSSHDSEVLCKSSVVLLVACWEAFVEDLINHSLDYLVANTPNPQGLPKIVLERVGSTHAGIKAWDLAGDGWKRALRDNLQTVLATTTGKFNTPRTGQVDELFKKTLGLESISREWTWDGTTQEEAGAALDDLIALRGAIAHRVKTASEVSVEDALNAERLVYNLAVRSHNAVVDFLKQQVGSSPWKRLSYRKKDANA